MSVVKGRRGHGQARNANRLMKLAQKAFQRLNRHNDPVHHHPFHQLNVLPLRFDIVKLPVGGEHETNKPVSFLDHCHPIGKNIRDWDRLRDRHDILWPASTSHCCCTTFGLYALSGSQHQSAASKPSHRRDCQNLNTYASGANLLPSTLRAGIRFVPACHEAAA